MARGSITRDDVAKAAGVSPATVSHVVNNSKHVSKGTRQRVLDAIKALDYHPNAIASSLRRQRTKTIGLIIPDNKNTFFSEIALGVEEVAFDRGYTVILGHSAYIYQRELAYINMMISHQVAGVIWIPGSEETTPARNLENFNIPFFLLDRVIKDVDAPTITVDNFKAAFMATQHLIELGHKRIAFIKRPTDLSHSIDRLNGYKEALRRFRLPYISDLIVAGGFKMEEGFEAGEEILSKNPRPTAIVAYNDINALGAMKAIQLARLHVPGDMSVVGIDDIAQSEYSHPSLTSICMPMYEMGTISANNLIDLIDNKPSEEKFHMCLSCKLTIRDSSAPPGEVNKKRKLLKGLIDDLPIQTK